MVDGHSEAEVKTDDDGVEYDEKRFVPKGLHAELDRRALREGRKVLACRRARSGSP
jgi:hypothetical protein